MKYHFEFTDTQETPVYPIMNGDELIICEKNTENGNYRSIILCKNGSYLVSANVGNKPRHTYLTTLKRARNHYNKFNLQSDDEN